MLPQPLRLTRQGFLDTRSLKRVHSAHFSLSYGENKELGGTAIIVPKKAVKGAVARHLLKRRLRAILLPHSSPTHVLIVSARTGANTLSYQEVESELSTLLRSIMKSI